MGEKEIIYLWLHCHHQNDFCVKVGSDESHFNVQLIVRDMVTRQCPQTTTFEVKGEPKRIRTKVLLLTSLPSAYLTARPNRLTTQIVSGANSFITSQAAYASAILFYFIFCGLNRDGTLFSFFFIRGGRASCLRACLGALLLPQSY